jgi:hypothetical protein
MEIIDVHALQQVLRATDLDYVDVLRLLFDLSDVILRDKLRGDVDLLSVLAATKNETASRKELAQRVTRLKPVDRLRCCATNKANVRNVGGRFLLLNPHNESELLFGDSPVAWIRNGLWAIAPKILPLSSSAGGGWFLSCPALAIQPCEAPGNRKITTRTVPALYIGTRFRNTEIAEWRARFWVRDIADGYALRGKELQAAWLQQVPGAAEPDPVYRFLRAPSKDLRDEALLFLRQAHDKVHERTDVGGGKPAKVARPSPAARPKRGSWAHDGSPPKEENWWPLEFDRPAIDLAKAIGVCVPTMKDMNKNKKIWVMCIHGTSYQVWFKTKHECDKARKNIELEQKNT